MERDGEREIEKERVRDREKEKEGWRGRDSSTDRLIEKK